MHFADPDCIFVKNAYRSMLRSLELFHADAIAMRELFGENTVKCEQRVDIMRSITMPMSQCWPLPGAQQPTNAASV